MRCLSRRRFPVLWAALLLLLLFLTTDRPVMAADEAVLTLDLGGAARSHARAELLARPDLETVAIAEDVAYPGQVMTYRAIRLSALLDGAALPADGVVQFTALDGFVANIPVDRLLPRQPDRSVPYLAIEPAPGAWPPVRPGESATAGPFYLVWQHPERTGIVPEEWPYQVAHLAIKDPVAMRFPAMAPDPALPADSPERTGFAAFTRHCFACHTLNRQGEAEIGPDLSLPYGPTEYLRPDMLRRLIRDPQTVRHYPQSRMPAFDVLVLGDAELDALLAYLGHMVGRKTAVPPTE